MVIIYACVCLYWWSGFVGVAEELAARFAFIVDSQSVAAASIFPVGRPYTHSRGEGGGGEERDGREQYRDKRLRTPEMFDPLSGREKHFSRGRGIEMYTTKCRRDILFNNKTDTMSRSKIISVQTEPS